MRTWATCAFSRGRRLWPVRAWAQWGAEWKARVSTLKCASRVGPRTRPNGSSPSTALLLVAEPRSLREASRLRDMAGIGTSVAPQIDRGVPPAGGTLHRREGTMTNDDYDMPPPNEGDE